MHGHATCFETGHVDALIVVAGSRLRLRRRAWLVAHSAGADVRRGCGLSAGVSVHPDLGSERLTRDVRVLALSERLGLWASDALRVRWDRVRERAGWHAVLPSERSLWPPVGGAVRRRRRLRSRL